MALIIGLEGYSLPPPAREGIDLATRANRAIRNSVGAPESDAVLRNQHKEYRKDHPFLRERSGPDVRYNCFGHVWATRRTWITDSAAIQMILQDDGYRRLNGGEAPVPGDLALYHDGSDFVHAAVVLWVDQFDGDGRMTKLLSKMRHLGEFIHEERSPIFPNLDPHFHTDRPLP